ncbi:MAG: DUF362 domain-containing protein, partial [Candidatus Methylomirabilales bacterium]
RLGIVQGEDRVRMTRRAVDALGGMGRFVGRGDRVLVKPNVVAGDPPPTTTSPELVKALIALLYQAGASKVKVGEMSAFITLPTMRNLEKTGMKQAAEAAGAEVIVFDEGPWVEVKHPLAKHVGPFWVAKAVYEAEVFVSLPVIKTHRSASYSLSLKNSIGFIHPRNRPSLYGAKDWEEIVAEVNLALSPHLIIADGLKSMIAGGPWGGEAVETKVLLASGDLVAIDLVGLGLIKHFGRWEKVAKLKVWEQRQIRRAVEIGLGARSPEELEIVSRSLVGEDPAFSGLVEAIRTHVFA